MKSGIKFSRLVERLLEKNRHRAEQCGALPAKGLLPGFESPGMTITLAREAGTPGSEIAHEVGRRLSWPVYDHELLEHMAADMGIEVGLLESVDEKRTPWLLEALESFMAVPMVTENQYTHQLITTVLTLGLQGECVIVGRGTCFILPPRTTLRVRLVAPRELRVARLAEQHGLATSAAARYLQQLDQQREGFIREHFCQNPRDSHYYDLVLNLANLSVDKCAAMILDALQMRQTGRAVVAAGKGEAVSLTSAHV